MEEDNDNGPEESRTKLFKIHFRKIFGFRTRRDGSYGLHLGLPSCGMRLETIVSTLIVTKYRGYETALEMCEL